MSAPVHRLLFVCTGNICRSPMAEGIAIAVGKETGQAIQARSASTLGLVDRPADPHAVTVCEELSIDLSAHRSRPVLAEDVAWADYILVMALHHANAVRDGHPEADRKIMMLGTFGGMLEISDPVGKSVRRFRESRDVIARCVRAFAGRLPR